MHNGELELVCANGHGERFLQEAYLIGILVGNAEMANLACLQKLIESAGNLIGLHKSIGAMEKEDIDIIRAQAQKALVNG